MKKADTLETICTTDFDLHIENALKSPHSEAKLQTFSNPGQFNRINWRKKADGIAGGSLNRSAEKETRPVSFPLRIQIAPLRISKIYPS